ncbi:thiolase family protein [Streptomyces luteolus]|uniref:Thiolase family protein n=1 Tax=Streptomyces luteolus TaxID=3043615 RepID=A0ABT6SX35_9ACTN|nr:thiolase family protein [Streptomyces sp. B-S-A12]MDI3420146.1 thiolase family protein [Streptomyces sp. B-S-A12]
MRDAVIVEAVRTPIGRREGALSALHPVDLSASVLRSLAERTGIDPSVVEDVIWGCVGQVGEQSANIGRNAVLAAGWPESVPGTTVDRQCGSSQQAIHFAAATVIAGHAEVVVAGGVESMSRVPMGSARANGPGLPFGDLVAERYDGYEFHQGKGAEILAARYDLSRTWLDAYAVSSHERAAAAIDGGRFAKEVVPVTLPDGSRFDLDEGVRRRTHVDRLAALRPAFAEDGRMTAGNSSQISDGSAAVLVTTSERAGRLGLTPLARVHSATAVGSDPIAMLGGPIPATADVLAKAGLGPVSPIFAGPRRLARSPSLRPGVPPLAARQNHPSTSSTRAIRAHSPSLRPGGPPEHAPPSSRLLPQPSAGRCPQSKGDPHDAAA